MLSLYNASQMLCVCVCLCSSFLHLPTWHLFSLSYKICQMSWISQHSTLALVLCQMPSYEPPLGNHKGLRLTKWRRATKYSRIMFADGKPNGCKCERLQCSCVLSHYRHAATEKTNFAPCLCTLCFAQSFLMWLTICWRQRVAIGSSVHQGTNGWVWLTTLTWHCL